MKPEILAWQAAPIREAESDVQARISANLWSKDSDYSKLPNSKHSDMNGWLESWNLLGKLSIETKSSAIKPDLERDATEEKEENETKDKHANLRPAAEQKAPGKAGAWTELSPLSWASEDNESKHETSKPDTSVKPEREIVRSASQRNRFYLTQDDGVSCSAFAMGMMYSDHIVGRPLKYGQETDKMKELAGVGKHGYRGDLQSMADKLETLGLKAKAYQYAKVDKEVLEDLNAELALGHTAIAWVKNPMSGNGHYIYVAGRTADGDYILGDSGGTRRGYAKHLGPVSAGHLLKMMKGRYGFVAGWAAEENTDAAGIKGTAAYLRKHS